MINNNPTVNPEKSSALLTKDSAYKYQSVNSLKTALVIGTALLLIVSLIFVSRMLSNNYAIEDTAIKSI
jgi:hypothetical protein